MFIGKKVLGLAVAVAAVMFFASGYAEAGIIFSDNFEGYSVGAANPGGWLEDNAANGDNAVAAVPLSGTGSQSLDVSNTTAWYRMINTGPSYTLVSTEYVQLDYYVRRTGGTKKFEVAMYSDAGLWAGTVSLAYGTIRYQAEGGTINTGIAYTLDTDYRFRQTFYPADYGGAGNAAYWEFYVDDMSTPVATDLLWKSQMGDIGSIKLVYAGASTGYVDDISIQSIPEPGTLILLGLGMVLTGIGLRKRQTICLEIHRR